MPIALYMDHNVPRQITDGLRLRQVDVITALEDGTEIGIDLPVTFEDAKDDGLAAGPAAALAAHAPRTKVRLINFDLASKGRGAFTFFGDPFTDSDKKHGHRAARQASEFGCFTGRQIMREVADDLAQFTFTNFGTSVIAI